MKRRLVSCSVALSLAIACIAVALWVYNQYAAIYLVWTQNREHNQVICRGGSIHFFQNHNWWRHEPLTCLIVPEIRMMSRLPTYPSRNWVGMSEVTWTGFLGLEYAHGKWQSPYVIVPPNTQFTSDLKIAVGSNFSTTSRFDLYSVPLWLITLLASVMPSVVMFKRYGSARQSQLREGDDQASFKHVATQQDPSKDGELQ